MPRAGHVDGDARRGVSSITKWRKPPDRLVRRPIGAPHAEITMPDERVVTFFTRPECSLCDAALFALRRVRAAHPFELAIVNIDEPGQEAWLAAYRHDIPVIHLDGVEIFRHRVDERRLRAILREEH